ncbi:hypothetical protein ANN_00942 [Periplaneta americana]|uniref:Reverse transcriptase domain-containing protein n=1 Tax=Periplaneta americana TaxID=6978 RepID=A0ABQ8TTV9_PERAM|nr:hypothetical protein ANN_00942 [Periplaneta americana]
MDAADDEAPLNLCTKPRRSLGIWSPASLCEQELKEEEEDAPHPQPSSSWDSEPHPAARPPATTTTTTSSERTFQCPKSAPRVITYRDIKRIDNIALKEDAAQLPWHMIWTLRTVDEKVDLFKTLILQLYDKHAPLKTTKRTRRNPAPWMTTEIRSLMSERDLAYRKYTRNKNDEYFNSYKHLRNRTTLIRNAKLKYSYKLIEPNTTPSELWKNLKVIGLGRASEQADIPIPLDRLNEHFVKDPSLNDTTKQDTVLPDSVPPTRDKFYFTDVTPIDVMKAIRRIKTKAQGPGNISIILIQNIQETVIPTIAHIFNSSLITSTFPKIWKQAFVLPLPKIKVPTDPNDYRPISILPAISKALERIVHRQITNYMNEHKLFDKYQSGFRAGHNTSTALFKVTEDIREAINSNKVTILTLLDLSKAFNSVNFDLLTHKLRNMYLSETAVSWFETYLRERQQCVVSGNRSSSWLDITSGIPQGSVLGPLLFTIYVNDITSLVRHYNYHLYADDLQCYISSRLDRVNDAIDKLNEDIDSIVTWTKKLHLKINPGKTQAIILGHKRQTDAVKHLDISPVKGSTVHIPFSSSVKNLGIHMDNNLNWDMQITETCRKVYSIIHVLKRINVHLPSCLKTSLVQTLVFPYFDYADILLTDLSSNNKMKLQRAHNLCPCQDSGIRYLLASGTVEIKRNSNANLIGTWLNGFDGIGDGDMRPMIRRRLTDIRLAVGETAEKPNQAISPSGKYQLNIEVIYKKLNENYQTQNRILRQYHRTPIVEGGNKRCFRFTTFKPKV